MEPTHAEMAARSLVDEFRERFAPLISEGMGRALLAQIEVLVRSAVRAERRDCEDVCIERAALWNGYITRNESGAVRAEAEMREKEALYLADAIGARDVAS
jgi:hypothetical protein